jgi:hypothetical protein
MLAMKNMHPQNWSIMIDALSLSLSSSSVRKFNNLTLRRSSGREDTMRHKFFHAELNTAAEIVIKVIDAVKAITAENIVISVMLPVNIIPDHFKPRAKMCLTWHHKFVPSLYYQQGISYCLFKVNAWMNIQQNDEKCRWEKKHGCF